MASLDILILLLALLKTVNSIKTTIVSKKKLKKRVFLVKLMEIKLSSIKETLTRIAIWLSTLNKLSIFLLMEHFDTYIDQSLIQKMVKQSDIDKLQCLEYTAGNRTVLPGHARAPVGMIVCQHHV